MIVLDTASNTGIYRLCCLEALGELARRQESIGHSRCVLRYLDQSHADPRVVL
jgi:hypothetical protein